MKSMVIPLIAIVAIPDDDTTTNGEDIRTRIDGAMASHIIVDAINDFFFDLKKVQISHIHAGPCGDPT
jgi:hypothetical protein